MGLDNPLHIAILLLVVLLLFGAKRLPEMGRSLGTGIHGFKDALSGNGAHAELAQAHSSPVPATTDAEQAPVA